MALVYSTQQKSSVSGAVLEMNYVSRVKSNLWFCSNFCVIKIVICKHANFSPVLLKTLPIQAFYQILKIIYLCIQHWFLIQ